MPIETFHVLAHTISNKLVSKVSAQKKGEKSYDSYICVQISVVSGVVPLMGRLCVALVGKKMGA